MEVCSQIVAIRSTLLQHWPWMEVDRTPFTSAKIILFAADPNTCTYTPATTEQRYWQVQVAHTLIESVAVSITPSSHQQFTIFVIELVGSKALYKPCATFKVQSQVSEESM